MFTEAVHYSDVHCLDRCDQLKMLLVLLNDEQCCVWPGHGIPGVPTNTNTAAVQGTHLHYAGANTQLSREHSGLQTEGGIQQERG